MTLESLVSTYGYAAIAVGTFAEGETVLVLGGFAAHRGYLELPWVLVSAFLGTLLGDQLFFYLGRTKGKSVLAKRPGWKDKTEKVFALLNKNQVLLITGFRFLYGLRTVTPFLIGASRIPPLRFLILNSLGAFIWAIVIGVMGTCLARQSSCSSGISNVMRYGCFWVWPPRGWLYGVSIFCQQGAHQPKGPSIVVLINNFRLSVIARSVSDEAISFGVEIASLRSQ